MMRFYRIIPIVLMLSSLSVLSLSCAAKSTTPTGQVVAVQRGDLRIDITGVGNLALSQKDDLAFEIAGTVAEVLVEEGDTVEKGQVLAKLDTADWEEQVSALEEKVIAAERNVTAKERAVVAAERQLESKKDAVTAAERQLESKKDAVTAAERQLETKKDAVIAAERQLAVKKRNVTAKERDVVKAGSNLKDAQTVLDRTQVTYTVADFTKAEADVDAAKTELETALQKLFRYEVGTDAYWFYRDLLSSAQAKLETAQAKLDAMLSGYDEELAKNKQLVDDAQWNLESAQIAVEDAQVAVGDAQKAIKDAQIAVEDAEKDIDDAQIAVEDAQKAIKNAQITVEDAQLGIADAQLAVKDAQKGLDDARKKLDEARNTSLEIIAPSAGFITKVNVVGGNEVKKGTVAVTLADPDKFEADIQVNEMDYPKIKLGGSASVQVDALPGLSLTAEIAHIAPTATIQQGVVSYKVKVEIAPLPSVTAQPPLTTAATGNVTLPPATMPQRPGMAATGNITPGAPAGRFGATFGSGNLTPEQFAEMRRQRQTTQGGQAEGQQRQMPAMVTENLKLAEGLTVTVSIVVEEKNDVLRVPNTAITTRRGQTYVQAVTAGGATEERAIQTGISNWQYTEVIAGLSEGEEVFIPQTATTPTQSTQGQGGRGPGMPGGIMFR